MGTTDDLLRQAVGSAALSEFDSSEVLSEYGIPVAAAILTTSAVEAVSAAEELGYPVVLKGCGADLIHKSEAGVIRLNILNSDAVTAAFDDIRASGPETMDGILVQELIKGRRELVAGMVRDSQFGPCVMFGLGGILAEVLNDVSFRIAPLGERDAIALMDEIRGAAILEPVRGMSAADRSTLARSLSALGRIGLEHDLIDAIDVNPMLLRDDGSPVAVDATIYLTTRS